MSEKTLNPATLNDSARDYLEEILAKDLNSLTVYDIGFLKARVAYLTADQREFFSDALKGKIKGIDFAYLTLHVGLGTFRKVEVEDLTKHKMDSEEIHITEECVEKVNQAKRNKKRICAVGTTSMRVMETSVSTDGFLKPYDGWTNKFIFPPYDFSLANCMITNFHTPESTLLMMVSAFGGYDLIMKAYKLAIKEKYRFYTYGDAMLII